MLKLRETDLKLLLIPAERPRDIRKVGGSKKSSKIYVHEIEYIRIFVCLHTETDVDSETSQGRFDFFKEKIKPSLINYKQKQIINPIVARDFLYDQGWEKLDRSNFVLLIVDFIPRFL